jgi:hypothetical protein
MRRLHKQLIIRTDIEGNEIIKGYCKEKNITLVQLLENIIERIKNKTW